MKGSIDLKRRATRFALLLSRLLAWQVAIQALGLAAGFALLRWLDVEAYAEYTVAFGFVTTVSFLVDLGFGQAVVALVGDRADDERVTDGYIVGARRLRNLTMAALLPIAAVPFALITEGKGWSASTRAGLFASVALSIVARSFADYYGLRLVMRQHHSAYLGPQVVAGAARMVSLIASRAAGVLTAVVASMLSSLLSIVPALQYRRRSGPLPASRQHAHEREILSYALPLAPMLLYTAFQSQVAIFVVATFGSTRAIADIGALSRLAQLYSVVGIVNVLVIAPKIARAPREALKGLVMLSIGGAVAFSAVTALVAFVAPGVFTALLGSTYASLSSDIGPYVCATGLTFVSGVVFVINSARRYLYWWLTLVLIAGVVGLQAVAAVELDLGMMSNVLTFLILTGGAQLAVAVAGLCYGMNKGPRADFRGAAVGSVPGLGGEA